MGADEWQPDSSLAFNYMIESRKEKGIAQPNDMVVKTIVTTDMIDAIAEANGVKCYNVLPVLNGLPN